MPVPAYVAADEALADRVVLNLLSNAIQFGRPGGNVWVGLQPTEGGYQLSVRDDGPGISARAQQALFEPFKEPDPQAMQRGSGVGLYLASEFCKAMGWQLRLESDKKGTLALVTAPVGQLAPGGQVAMASGALAQELRRQEQAGRVAKEMEALFGELK